VYLQAAAETDSGHADVTFCGRLFQTRAALQRPARLGRRYLTTAYGGQSLLMKRSGTQTTSNLEVCWLAKFVSKVRQCCSVVTRVDKESELEINSPPCLQPVQLAQKWSDVVVPRRREYQPSSEVHHRLKSLGHIQRDAGEVGVSVIQPRQNKRHHQGLQNAPGNGAADTS